MFKSLKQYLLEPTKIAGLEIFQSPKGEYHFNLVLLKKNDNQILIEAKYDFYQLEELSQYLDFKTPLSLVFTGKFILERSTNTGIEEPFSIHQILPNVKEESFSYQTQKGTNSHWLSLMRKNILEEQVLKIKALGYDVIEIQLGSCIVQSIYPFINHAPENILTFSTQLHFKESEITEISPIKNQVEEYMIGDEKIESPFLLAFTAAFSLFISLKKTIFNIELLENTKKDYQDSLILKKIGWISLFTVFIILFINAILFSYWHHRNIQFDGQISQHKEQLILLDSLRKQLTERQSFIAQNKIIKASNISLLADQLGAIVPDEIRLLDLEFFPQLEKKSKAERLTSYLNQIKIVGESQRSISLNIWIKGLEELSWVKEVKVLPYREEVSGKGAFELELLLY